MNWRMIRRNVVSCFLACTLAAAQDIDDMFFDVPELDAKDAAALADKIIKNPSDYPPDVAIQLIAHQKLHEPRQERQLYEVVKSAVTPEHYEILSESPLLESPSTDPVTASLVIQLVGRTRAPGARHVLLRAFRSRLIGFKAAGARAVGLYGDKSLLPLLEKEYRQVMAKGPAGSQEDYVDGLVMGMLYLGKFKYFHFLLAKAARISKQRAGTALKIASGYTPPHAKLMARKQMVFLKWKHKQMQADIAEIALLFPREIARFIVDLDEPNECDILYRLLPRLMKHGPAQAFTPILYASNPDLRQLCLDTYLDGVAGPAELAAVTRAVLKWCNSKDPIGRIWGIENTIALAPETRRAILSNVLANGTRWERIAAIKATRYLRDEALLKAARDLQKKTNDPDILFHVARLFVRP